MGVEGGPGESGRTRQNYLDGIDKWDDPGKYFHIGPVIFAKDKDKLKEEEEMRKLLNPIERKLYVLGAELKREDDIGLINLIETLDIKIATHDGLAEQSSRIAKYVQGLREGRRLVIKELDSRGDEE